MSEVDYYSDSGSEESELGENANPNLWLLISKNKSTKKYALTHQGNPIYQPELSSHYLTFTDCSQTYVRCPYTNNVYQKKKTCRDRTSRGKNTYEWCGKYIHDPDCPNCQSKFRDCWFYVDYQK